MAQTLEWTPGSWRRKPAEQLPTYPDQQALQAALQELGLLPPLVAAGEILALRKQLGEVADGTRFLIQGGDCSERFEECRPQLIAAKLKVLLQMSLILVDASKMKIVRIGRIAGQYAKPRSSLLETKDGVTLPAYQGDLINRPGFTEAQRIPNPQNLLDGYKISAMTLNYVRSLVGSSYSKVWYPGYWDLGFAAHTAQAAAYRDVITRILRSLEFVDASVGAPLAQLLTRFDFFTSHEGLLLPFEEALTQQVPTQDGWFNQSTHFPWIGDRTRALDGAHVEYFRGLENPVGVKIGPKTSAEELLALAEVLNPRNIPGKLTFIHRFGSDKIEKHLPPLLEAIKRTNHRVAWCCDAMHGNTVSENGVKTRDFGRILTELRLAFQIHKELGTYLGGVHLELTGENVTECVGGARNLKVSDLGRAYKTAVDPRLNHEQALELAFEVGQLMRKWNPKVIK